MNTVVVVGLLAGAVLAVPSPTRTEARLRTVLPSAACREGTGAGVSRLRSRMGRLSFLRPDQEEPLRLAAAWDLLAAFLRAGLPIPAAIHGIVGDLPAAASAPLAASADLLALGSEPGEGWAPALACPHTAELARSACRTARSGAALAETAAALADRIRDGTGDRAEARAQRTAVLVTGPLGLCFLPAFLCLGVIPVVAGLASQLAVLS
ncbi:type II secretion system protein F (GspF) [Amycolatopsis marina]|uniref:Type II secretion system protein F (GspF) n=1 Tax=Amycolatopsis marina TaxID=490629 RepID=A0A1I0Y9N6_9PSEU|nr:type II secretion system F family protein [Amycolatopsis marina]SFB09517.1 type II secretion system protein F (GspF) [Amycolatopsis marina]